MSIGTGGEGRGTEQPLPFGRDKRGCPQRREEHKGGARGLTATARRLTTNTRMNAVFRDNDEKCYSCERRVMRETLRGRKSNLLRL